MADLGVEYLENARDNFDLSAIREILPDDCRAWPQERQAHNNGYMKMVKCDEEATADLDPEDIPLLWIEYVLEASTLVNHNAFIERALEEIETRNSRPISTRKISELLASDLQNMIEKIRAEEEDGVFPIEDYPYKSDLIESARITPRGEKYSANKVAVPAGVENTPRRTRGSSRISSHQASPSTSTGVGLKRSRGNTPITREMASVAHNDRRVNSLLANLVGLPADSSTTGTAMASDDTVVAEDSVSGVNLSECTTPTADSIDASAKSTPLTNLDALVDLFECSVDTPEFALALKEWAEDEDFLVEFENAGPPLSANGRTPHVSPDDILQVFMDAVEVEGFVDGLVELGEGSDFVVKMQGWKFGDDDDDDDGYEDEDEDVDY